MTQPVNKDLLIALLTQQNQKLELLVKGQQELMDQYKEKLQLYKEMDETRKNLSEEVEELVKSLTDQIHSLEKTVEDQKMKIEAFQAKGGVPEQTILPDSVITL